MLLQNTVCLFIEMRRKFKKMLENFKPTNLFIVLKGCWKLILLNVNITYKIKHNLLIKPLQTIKKILTVKSLVGNISQEIKV